MVRDNKLSKDMIVTIEIDDVGSEGEGIGHIDGYALFVKDTVMGDVAEVKIIKTKKSYGYGRLIRIITPSAKRVEPVCSIARQCGGCQIQHINYKDQLIYKENKVRNCLTRIGGFEESLIKDIMEPIIGMENPYYYRNKAQFPIGRDEAGNVVIGFYARRTHSIMDTTHCYIQAEVNVVILEKVKTWITKYNISTYDEIEHKGLLRHILTRVGFTTDEIMVCLIINGYELPHKEELIESLTQIENMKSITINKNTKKTNVILGDELDTIWGTSYITDYIGDIKYGISPLSFYQVNPVQTKALYETALEYADLNGEEVVWDLYCGIGTISLFLAQKAKQVYGVEIIPQAIEDARKNADINSIENVEFFVGEAEEVLPRKFKEEKIYADIIVVDPPRKGCAESLLDTIVEMRPNKVVYVSCDPATLSRDVKYLCDRGYELRRIKAVDQFSHTVHVETCVLLSHKNS